MKIDGVYPIEDPTHFKGELDNQCRRVGVPFAAVNLVLLPLLLLADFFIFSLQWTLVWRAIPLVACFLFLLLSGKSRAPGYRTGLYGILLFSLLVMAFGLDMQGKYLGASIPVPEVSSLNYIVITLIVVHLFSAGAVGLFPFFTGIPFLVYLGALFFSGIEGDLLLVQGVNVGLFWLILSIMSLLRYRLRYRDHLFRRNEESRTKALTEEKKRFESLFQLAPDAIFLEASDGTILDCNRKAEEVSGYSRMELLSMNARELVPRDENPFLPEFAGSDDEPGSLPSRIMHNVRKDGSRFPVEVNSRNLGPEGGNRLIVVVRDITERIRRDDQIRTLSTAIEYSPSSIVITDPEGIITYVNPKFTEVTGYTFPEVLGNNPKILKSGRQDRQFYQELWETILGGREWSGEFYNLAKGGRGYWESAAIAPVLSEEGGIRSFVAVKEDITEQKKRKEELLHLAMYDPLTGLANRTLFLQTLSQSLARAKRYKEPLTILYVDLDRFKPINDSYGHQAGDQVLRETGKRFKAVIRKMDLAARLGGDEFALLLHGPDAKKAAPLTATRLQEAISAPIQLEQTTVSVGASIGIASFPEDGTAPDTLLKCADQGMYKEKAAKAGTGAPSGRLSS